MTHGVAALSLAGDNVAFLPIHASSGDLIHVISVSNEVSTTFFLTL